MSRVYVVVRDEGSYSDYSRSLLGVFSTPELARAAVARDREERIQECVAAWDSMSDDRRAYFKNETRDTAVRRWTADLRWSVFDPTVDSDEEWVEETFR